MTMTKKKQSSHGKKILQGEGLIFTLQLILLINRLYIHNFWLVIVLDLGGFKMGLNFCDFVIVLGINRNHMESVVPQLYTYIKNIALCMGGIFHTFCLPRVVYLT